jgi:GNAT superfamily N-acetyltransferase
MGEIVVRRAQSHDRDACLAIYAAALPLARPGAGLAADSAAFDRDTEGEQLFVADHNGVAAGLASYYRPANFLHHLYVDPWAHGLGIGSALLTAVVAHAPVGITLKVNAANHRGRAFYEKHGWTLRGDGEDAFGRWLLLGAPSKP